MHCVSGTDRADFACRLSKAVDNPAAQARPPAKIYVFSERIVAALNGVAVDKHFVFTLPANACLPNFRKFCKIPRTVS